jgi:hypothetical protein
LTVFSKQFIDASADADLAAMAGVPYTFAGEDIGEKKDKWVLPLFLLLAMLTGKKLLPT